MFIVNFLKPNGNMHTDYCSEVKGIATDIYQIYQSLPVEINKLWRPSKKKVSFQWISSKWDKKRQKNDSCSIFVGGSHKEDENIVLRLCIKLCIKIESRSSTVEWLLQCSYEKVDQRVAKTTALLYPLLTLMC